MDFILSTHFDFDKKGCRSFLKQKSWLICIWHCTHSKVSWSGLIMRKSNQHKPVGGNCFLYNIININTIKKGVSLFYIHIIWLYSFVCPMKGKSKVTIILICTQRYFLNNLKNLINYTDRSLWNDKYIS